MKNLFILLLLLFLALMGCGNSASQQSEEEGNKHNFQTLVRQTSSESLTNKTSVNEPEYLVRLESVSFNHTPNCGYYDAIDISQKSKIDEEYGERIRPPEWGREKKNNPLPAAYIKNRCITIKATFSASTNLNGVIIGADTCSGRLGNVVEKVVDIDQHNTVNNYKSWEFQVKLPTPGEITSFYQEWAWYYKLKNSTRFHFIGNSRNKIFIILAQPQSPWNTGGKSTPWTEVLDFACTWAHGETTPEKAATKITYYLYHHVGAIYNENSKRCIDTKSNTQESFSFKCFLERVPEAEVGNIDCKAMGKAMVTFFNVVGCGASYRFCKNFGTYLNCTIPAGTEDSDNMWQCPYLDNDYHAFCSIGDKIFDAVFYYISPSKNSSRAPYSAQVAANISWEDYKRIIIQTGNVSYPETRRFHILR